MATPGENYGQRLKGKFGWEEYSVFAAVLLLSTGVGLFYGIFKQRNKTQDKDEYLMGGRKMRPFPVALSLMVSFVSAISILGNPMEVYYYGTQYFVVILSFIPMTFALMYVYVPVYFKMQLTSSFEYLEIRFNAPARYIVSIVNTLYLIMFMGFVVYAPSLALNQVTGFDTNWSVVAIFIICIFYSTLGGFRAVLMTDAIQGFLMVGGLIAVLIKGFMDESLSSIWDKAERTGRVEFFRVDADPRTRYTLWSTFFGGFFMYLNSFAGTQANIQRYSSLPNMRSVKIALLWNYVALTLMMTCIMLMGLLLLGKYFDCDPSAANLVKASDQTVPFLVMDILGDYPGLPGVFVAGITSATLSTVSSGLNALAAVITEDYIRKFNPEVSDKVLLHASRSVSLISGLLSFGWVFIAKNLGNIYPVAISLGGMVMGPTTGIFTLGIIFPWANGWGAFFGVLCSYCLTGLLTVGSALAGPKRLLPDQTMSISTGNCSLYLSKEELENIRQVNHTLSPGLVWKEKHEDDSGYYKLISTSYFLVHLIGVLGSVIFGLIFSFIVKIFKKDDPVKEICVNPYFLKFYRWAFPNHMKAKMEFEKSEIK